MANNNVYSNATIVKANNQEEIKSYELGTFSGGNVSNQNQKMKNVAKLNETNINGNVDPVLGELQKLQTQFATLDLKITNIENNGVSEETLIDKLLKLSRT